MLTEQPPGDSARRYFAALNRRPRRRLALLLSLLMGVLGLTYFPEPLLSLAEDAPPEAASNQPQRYVDATIRYIPETRVQEVVDPKTGKATQEQVVIWRPATEATNHGGPPGVPAWQPAIAAPLSDAESRAFELAQRIKQAESQTEQEPLQQKLAEALAQAFDERRQQQQQAIERLEQQLKSLRELAAKRDERKDEIIQRRVAELLGQPDPLAWDAEVSGASGTRPPTSTYAMAPVPQSLPAASRQGFPNFLPPAARPVAPTPGPPASPPPGMPSPNYAPQAYAPIYPTTVPAPPTSVPPGAVPVVELTGGFDAAERLLSRLIELRQIRAEIKKWQLPLPDEDSESDSPEAGERAAKNREREQEGREQYLQGLLANEQTVVAKLELAEIAWQAVEQTLRNEVKSTERQAQTAAGRAETISKLFDTKATTSSELQAAQQTQVKSELELEAAKQRLAAWEKTEAILRKQREALE